MLDGLDDLVGHGTAPVNQHEEAVILAFGHHFDLTEDIFAPLVVGHLHGVENTSLCTTGTLVSGSGSLLVEQVDHVVHHGFLFCLQVGVVASSDVARRDSDTDVGIDDLISGDEEVIHSLTNDGQVTHFVIACVLVDETLHRSVHFLCCFGSLIVGVSVGSVILSVSSRLHRTITFGFAVCLSVLALVLTFAVCVSVVITLSIAFGLLVTGSAFTTFLAFALCFTIGSIATVFFLLRQFSDKFFCKGNDLVESLASIATIIHRHLISGQVGSVEHTLSEQVNVVDGVCFAVGNVSKHVTHDVVFHPLTTGFVVRTQAGELRLNHSLDANVLDDVDVVLNEASVSASGVQFFLPAFKRSVEGMRNFVGHEHVIDMAGHGIPNGQSQHTGIEVERCGFGRCIVNDNEIFSGEKASKNVGRMSGHVLSIPKTRGYNQG